jgi:cell shape-determining protein MreC
MNIIFILFILLISGCSSLGGLADEGSKSQAEFENKIQNTSSLNETSNSSSISNALIDSINSLNNLQRELESLEVEIETINSNLENVSSTEVDSETLVYLNELNALTEKSKKFVSALYDSTKIWDSYLSRQSFDPRELEDLNSTEFVDSLHKPLEIWE